MYMLHMDARETDSLGRVLAVLRTEAAANDGGPLARILNGTADDWEGLLLSGRSGTGPRGVPVSAG